MPVLGIVTCEILELEFAYILALDKTISRITILENEHSQRLIQVLASKGVQHIDLIENIDSFKPFQEKTVEILIQLLDIGLHTSKKMLQTGLTQTTLKLDPHVDVLLLGYGLCGNALEDPEVLFSRLSVPFFLPWDGTHPVDDCVGLFIGGREAYYSQQCKNAGTYFMTPGWTVHWKKIFDKEFGSPSVEMAQRIFSDYNRTLLVQTPVMDGDELKANTHEFNTLFGCSPEICTGSMDMLTKAYDKAKHFLL